MLTKVLFYVNTFMQVILELPYPPSVNAYWLQSGKRRYISKRGVEFKSAVAEICKDVPSFGDKPVEVNIILYPRDKRLLDLDNPCKGIFDSLQGFLYDNDQQVWKFTIERGEIKKGGGCQVTVNLYSKLLTNLKK